MIKPSSLENHRKTSSTSNKQQTESSEQTSYALKTTSLKSNIEKTLGTKKNIISSELGEIKSITRHSASVTTDTPPNLNVDSSTFKNELKKFKKKHPNADLLPPKRNMDISFKINVDWDSKVRGATSAKDKKPINFCDDNIEPLLSNEDIQVTRGNGKLEHNVNALLTFVQNPLSTELQNTVLDFRSSNEASDNNEVDYAMLALQPYTEKEKEAAQVLLTNNINNFENETNIQFVNPFKALRKHLPSSSNATSKEKTPLLPGCSYLLEAAGLIHKCSADIDSFILNQKHKDPLKPSFIILASFRVAVAAQIKD